jgi:TIR domain/SIR2-like domain
MRDADWTSLVYAVERGQCTLMLGPDAVSGTLDGERMPLRIALARHIKEQLGPAYAHLDPSNPSSVAQAALAQDDPFTLQGWVAEFYAKFDGDFDMLRDLAALPFELVINSSPGLSAHKIFLEVKPRAHGDFYDRTARARAAMPDPSVDAPVVYNLYGSLDQPPSLILTDSDRLDFLVAVVSDEPPLPPKLKSTLRDPDRSFLFLGFDLGQWQFRVLLHVLARERPRYKSFALELAEKGLDADTRDFYRAGHKIHFVSGDLAAFARELRSRVHIQAPDEPAGNGDQPALPPDAPVVFVCHASEDKQFAERVADGLQANGIESWLDKHDLQGGDEWDSMIRRTISEQVDYVVVLQSESLKSKGRGYVNREINLALDRQMEYRPPLRFIIPAVIDDPTNRLDDLDTWQSVDMTVPDGIDQLVRVIKRDLKQQAG